MKKTFIFLLLFLGAACAPSAARQSIEGRNPAPEFALPDLHGTEHSLSSYRGRVVLLNFWAPWCASCLPEMEEFRQLRDYFGGERFEILAVVVFDDGNKDVRSRYNYPVLLDRDKRVAEQFGVGALPVTFVLDKDGHIVSFPDPDCGTPTTVMQGPRGWSSLKVVRELERLIDE